MTYKLTNFVFTRMFKMAVWVYLALFVSEICLFYLASEDGSDQLRFEQMLEKAGVGTIFLISYLLVLVIFTVVLAGFYTGGKSVYSVVFLPVKPGELLFALIFPCVVNIFILFCVQCPTVMLLGKWYPGFVIKPMSDYLLLAFIRYKPLSILCPLTGLQVCRTLLITIAPAIVVVFAFFSAAARKYKNFVLSAICVLMIILSYSMQISSYSVPLMIAPILICTLMLWLSGKYIKRRAVV